MDEFKSKVLNTVNKHCLITQGSRVCAAVSGGADSMALLRFLMSVREALGFTLSAVNIEHGIRGRESIRDSEFVKNFCKEKDIPLQIFIVNAPKHAAETKQGIEAAARELRYRCFENLRKKADRLALAHHRGDQAETVLLRLFRGSGAGLSAMDYMRGNYYIRPFLDVSKAEILDYVSREKIPYVGDSSNSDDTYDRNYVRNRVMPPVAVRFPGAEAAIARAAANLRADNLYIESNLPPLRKEGGEAAIEFERFALPDALINRLIFKAFSLLGAEADIEERHINLIKELQREGESGAEIMLPRGLRAVKDYTCVSLLPPEAEDQTVPDSEFTDALAAGELVFGGRHLKLRLVSRKEYNDEITNYKSQITNKDSHNCALRAVHCALYKTLFADIAAIPANAVIRQRLRGDRFRKFGGGAAPLSDFFIDKKVPARKRGGFPLIADGCEVLCVCGMEIGEKLKVTRKTAKILKITIEENI